MVKEFNTSDWEIGEPTTVAETPLPTEIEIHGYKFRVTGCVPIHNSTLLSVELIEDHEPFFTGDRFLVSSDILGENADNANAYQDVTNERKLLLFDLPAQFIAAGDVEKWEPQWPYRIPIRNSKLIESFGLAKVYSFLEIIGYDKLTGQFSANYERGEGRRENISLSMESIFSMFDHEAIRNIREVKRLKIIAEILQSR